MPVWIIDTKQDYWFATIEAPSLEVAVIATIKAARHRKWQLMDCHGKEVMPAMNDAELEREKWLLTNFGTDLNGLIEEADLQEVHDCFKSILPGDILFRHRFKKETKDMSVAEYEKHLFETTGNLDRQFVPLIEHFFHLAAFFETFMNLRPLNS